MAGIAVIGAGAWGTALANLAARDGREVILWCRDAVHAHEMAVTRENARRLPGVALAGGVRPSADMAMLAGAEIVLLAVPTQVLRGVIEDLRAFLPAHPVLVMCAKGIERGTQLFPREIAAQLLPQPILAVLSGPSFAVDVARGLPTAVTLACADSAVAQAVQAVISAPWFRLYQTSDLCGVELGGAAKNVIAIACGIAAGRQLGASAGAALVARGFAELARLGRPLGARTETLMGLSGLGDLVLTCNSPQSRNYAYGRALATGLAPTSGGVVEGAMTAEGLLELADRYLTEMPIARAVHDIVEGRHAVGATIDALLARPLRTEMV